MKNKQRWEVMANLLKDKNPKVVAEIGVQRGHTSFGLLSLLPSIEKYYAIDPWTDYSKISYRTPKAHIYTDKRCGGYLEVFKNKCAEWEDKIEILRMLSSEAHVHIPDESLDLCFIDGNHDYEYVKEDIELYLPKMKKGGLLCGHDYESWPDYGHKGWKVKEAVEDCFGKDYSHGSDYTWWKWI